MLLALLAATFAPALAEEPVVPAAAPSPVAAPVAAAVLVSTFQPRNDEAVGLAALIEATIARRLAESPEVTVLAVEDSPAFPDYSARTYMESCPPGDAVGCTLLVGKRAGARFAVTGSVQALPGAARVEVSLLDIDGSRVMVSFTSDLPNGEDAGFAERVAEQVGAATRGEIGQEEDIRTGGPAKARPTEEEVAALLASEHDTGQVSKRARGKLDRPRLTMEDLAGLGGGEVAEPWTRLGMTPRAYLRYRNSGLPLREWRTRAYGRQFQLHLRMSAGWWHGPIDATYQNRYAYDDTLVVEDSYSATAPRAGDGATGAVEVAFGLLPWLDVAMAGGLAPGRLTVDVASVEAPTDPMVLSQLTGWFGPRVNAVLLPAASVRPGFGGGVTLVRTHAIDDYAAVPAHAYVFPAEWVAYANVYAGGEVRLDPKLDLFVRVPFDVRLAGGAVREERQTTESALVPEPPVADAGFGYGVLVGVQVRLFGREASESAVLEDVGEPRD